MDVSWRKKILRLMMITVVCLCFYRAALDAIKKLDEILKQKKAYRDVFLQDAVGLRNK